MKTTLLRTMAAVSVTALLLAICSQAYGDVASPEKYQTFKGTVVKVDDKDRTLKAEHFMADRRFHLADDCPIVVNGKPDGKLSDLRIGDTVMFNYENVDGVLVANRIARETGPAKPESSQTAQNKVTYPEK